MYTITKEFHFSAAHQLEGLPISHPCARLHGHNYVVKVILKSDFLDEVGFVKDYRELDIVKSWIDGNLDHKNLNEVFNFNPTAENIAKELFKIFAQQIGQGFLKAIEVSETPKTNCIYEPDSI
jgi:6-pyruvoyltetrahydropterin/6-carboxytetrahydropterin synthase